MPTGLNWVCPLCGLTGQHYAVGAVEHSVSNIADLRPRRSRVVLSTIRINADRLGNMFGLLTVIDYSSRSIWDGFCKGTTHLQHLSGYNDRLTGHVAFGNHHFLSQEYLAGGDFNAEVATGNHYPICFFQDLVKVCHALFILNFDNNFDSGAVGAEDLANISDVLGATNKGSENHVDTIFN